MSDKITTDIYLCNVPISPTNQIDFDDIGKQQEYFSSKIVVSYNNCRFQPRNQSLSVKGYVDELEQCNYGFFRNSYNGVERTFYFWILEKNASARETTEIIFAVDVFQTWQFDFNFNPCFIEREHVTSDKIGEHTIPESFELGDYITESRRKVDDLTGDVVYGLCVTDGADENDTSSYYGMFGKIFTGFMIKLFDSDNVDSLANEIQEYCKNGKADGIAYIFSYPKKILEKSMSNLSFNGETISGVCNTVEDILEYDFSDIFHKYFTWGEKQYIPYNNKLFVYPYSFLTVRNPDGANVVWKYENFDLSLQKISLKLNGTFYLNPHFELYPQNYNGNDNDIYNGISLQSFPLCSWNNDNFSNWYAQHRNTINAQSKNATASYRTTDTISDNNYNNQLDNRNTNMEKSAINTALSTANALGNLNILGAMSNAVGGIANNMLDFGQNGRNAKNTLQNTKLVNRTNYQNTIRSLMASVQDSSVQPNTCKGSTNDDGLDVTRETATFSIDQTCIKPEYARLIDMYFQMYGYKVNMVKDVDFKSRDKWNYIKTVNSSVYGNIPQNDCKEMEDILNTGLTVWHDEQYMYNYNVANLIKPF